MNNGKSAPNVPKQEIISFLTGRSHDARKMKEAVRELREQAPAELSRLRRAMTGEIEEEVSHAADRCEEVADCLQDYMELGGEAAARMPVVARHLEDCQRCTSALEVLKAMREESAAWKQFAASLAEPRSIVRHRGQWWWAQEGKPSSRLAQPDHELGRAVSDLLMLGRFALAMVHMAEAPLPLDLRLPDDSGVVHLRVETVRDMEQDKDFWNLYCSLDGESGTASVNVGLGTEEGMITGELQLRRGAREKCFPSVEPPLKRSYWLYFNWLDKDGMPQEHREELPIYGDRGKTNS